MFFFFVCCIFQNVIPYETMGAVEERKRISRRTSKMFARGLYGLKKKRKHILRTHTGGMVSGKKRVKVVAAFRYGKVFRVTLFVVHFAFFKFGAITAGVTPSSIRCKARWSIQNFFDVAGHVRILFFLPMLASRFFPPAHYTL